MLAPTELLCSAPSGFRVALPFLGCVSHYPFIVIYILKSLSCCIKVLMGGAEQLHQDNLLGF